MGVKSALECLPCTFKHPHVPAFIPQRGMRSWDYASCWSTYSLGVCPTCSRKVFEKDDGERKPTA